VKKMGEACLLEQHSYMPLRRFAIKQDQISVA
jgi:hypothetical protein